MAARASALNQSISIAPLAAASWLPRTPVAPQRGEPLDHAIRLGAVADHVTEVPQGVDRPDPGEHGLEGDEVAVDVRQHGDAHATEFSSAPLTTAVACAWPGRAGTSAGLRPRAVATTSLCPSSPGTATSLDLQRATAERGHAPGPRRPAPAPMSPRFHATRQPPGSSSGNASSTRSARDATARAVTAGQRPRWRESAARASARTGAASTVSSRPVAAATTDRNRGLLGDRLEEQRPRGRQRRRERDARVAAARPEVDGPVGPAFAKDSDRGQAVHDVTDRDRGRLADGRQVDRRRSTPAAAGRDRRSRRGPPGSAPAPGRTGRASRASAYAAGRVGVSRTRVGSGSRGRSTTRLLCLRAIRPRGAAPGVGIVSHHEPALRSSAAGPVLGRVSPGPSRTALPLRPAPVRMPDGRGPGHPASTELSTNPRARGAFVDNRGGCPGRVRRTGPSCGPAGRASGARRR